MTLKLNFEDRVITCTECGGTARSAFRIQHQKNCRYVQGIGGLTPAERNVAFRMSRGLTVKEIASELNLSPKTIEAHKYNLYRKLNIHNVATLTRMVVEWERAAA